MKTLLLTIFACFFISSCATIEPYEERKAPCAPELHSTSLKNSVMKDDCERKPLPSNPKYMEA